MNWILKNKKILCQIKSFFGFGRIKNISRSKKTKTLLIGLVLFCIFIPQVSLAFSLNPLRWFGAATIGVLLSAVQTFMVFLVGIASTVFGAIVDPSNISGSTGILSQQAVKDIWIMVRDTLNMFFILILLFSAFCTIFQVEKWNLQKVWLSILINALLVNFSWPIARFIIDVSNVAMYYFINNIFGSVTSAAGIFAAFCSDSEISKILFPANFAGQPFAYEIAMIVFTFILAITLLVIAILFAVRLMALTILVMFSPIGFVGYIFPATSNLADKWWKQLFSYAFFGPIMIFMLAVALKIVEAVGKNRSIFATVANGNSDPKDASFIASVALFSIPIILLWMGMGIGKSMGIAGSEAVVGMAQKAAKSVGKWASGYNYGKKNWDSFQASRKKRTDEIDKKRWGGNLGNKYNDKMDEFQSKHGTEASKKAAGERYTKRKQASRREDIKKEMENHDGIEDSDLYNQIKENRAKVERGETLTESDKIKAAALEKTALARGARYNDYVEKNHLKPELNSTQNQGKIKSKIKDETGLDEDPGKPPELIFKNIKPKSNRPADIAKFQADVAKEVAEHKRILDEHKEKVAKWNKAKEKAEKEVIKDMQEDYAKGSRKVISEADKVT